MGGMLLSYESLIDIDKRNNTAVILEKYFWDMQGAEEYVSIVDTPPAVYKNLDLPDISQLNTIIPTKLLPIKDFIVNAKKYTKINQEIFPSALYDLHPIIDLIIAYDVAEILDAHRTYDSVDELNAVWLKILTRHQKEQMSITQSEEKTKLTGIDTSAVPDFSDVTASVVSQLEGKGMGNVTVEYNQPVTFNSVDKNDIPQMEEFLKRAREDTTKYIVKELRKGGMQIRR